MNKLTETRPKPGLAILFLGLATATFATAADLNVPTTGYPTIQAAVNAAHANDTIHIAPGVYTGQVQIISKELTLIGQPGTILRATTNMSSFPGSVHVPIIGIRCSQVTVRGLTFEGERLAGRFVGPGDLEAIYLRQSSGIVENCAFYGFRESTPGPEFGTAIGVHNADNEANYPPVFGHLQSLTIEGNTLRDNQVHIILVQGDKSEVRNNRFQGTAPGIVPVGLAVTGTNVTIANNQFENMEEGIRLMGNDPNWGTLLGKAVDAQVTSNRFCGVTTPVTLQPLASAMQAGTLVICPIPPPPLAIAPAVLLSWPGEDVGWTVESAPSVNGPWAASDATPFMQYGRHSIAVPTDGEHRFFRLR